MKSGCNVDVAGGHMKYVLISQISLLMLMAESCFVPTIQCKHMQFSY